MQATTVDLHTNFRIGPVDPRIFGGFVEHLGRCVYGGLYDPVRNRWEPMNTSGAPAPRRDHGTVWTGGEMIVWAGIDTSDMITGGRYVVSQDVDEDLDGVPASVDCDDANGDVWATPGAVEGVVFASKTVVRWSPPAQPGCVAPAYDVLRSPTASDFVTGSTCVESGDDTDTEAEDPDDPAPSAVFHYLVRAVNDCPDGAGPVGEDSGGVPRSARQCP